MKKSLQHLHNNQAGSMFVYLFYLSTIILLFTIAIITQLENEQTISALEIEQLQLNMIHQQTYQTVMNNWDELNLSSTYTYTYPNGEARVVFTLTVPNYIDLTVTASREPPHQKIKKYRFKVISDEEKELQ